MSTGNVRDVVPVKEPARYFAVPGFDTVIVQYLSHYTGLDVIEYAGTPDALLVSGVVIADMLVINASSGPRIRRKDQDGRGWRVVRSWRHIRDGIECAPYRWFRVTRDVDGRLEQLPFGAEAFAVEQTWRRWARARRTAAQWSFEPMRPQLRLIVDNTRPEA